MASQRCQFEITETVSYGEHGWIPYERHRGTFGGALPNGEPFDAEIEIVAPKDPQAGEPCLVVEALHPNGTPIGRDSFLLPDFLFGLRFRHAWIRDQRPEALAAFVRCLRGAPPAPLGKVSRFYGTGASASGAVLMRLLLADFGQGVFDFSMPCTSGVPGFPRAEAGRVIRFDSEADVISLLQRAEGEAAAELRAAFEAIAAERPARPWRQHFRWCMAAAGPHIPDTPATGMSLFPPCHPLGTCPIDWAGFARALFGAGDRWVREGIEPPRSQVLRVGRGGELERDKNLHAVGGLRVPILDPGPPAFPNPGPRPEAFPEASFCALPSLCGLEDSCFGLVGAYRRVRRFGDRNFYADAESYLAAFRLNTRRLVEGGYLLCRDACAWDDRAEQAARRGLSYTGDYADSRPRLTEAAAARSSAGDWAAAAPGRP